MKGSKVSELATMIPELKRNYSLSIHWMLKLAAKECKTSHLRVQQRHSGFTTSCLRGGIKTHSSGGQLCSLLLWKFRSIGFVKKRRSVNKICIIIVLHSWHIISSPSPSSVKHHFSSYPNPLCLACFAKVCHLWMVLWSSDIEEKSFFSGYG